MGSDSDMKVMSKAADMLEKLGIEYEMTIILEAIREHCQSQHDMESTEIDRVMQRLPFVSEQDVFTRPPVPKPPYSWRSRNYRT